MSALKQIRNIPQVGRGNSQSHTGNPVSLTDSGGGKRTTYIQKNPKRPEKNTPTCSLNIATYNTRSIGSRERLHELEYELERINWDIVGLAETKRKGEECFRLDSGHTLFCKGKNEDSTGGVGILINKKLYENIKILKAISERVIYVIIRINKTITLKYIQVYMPTTAYDDEEVEAVYEEITGAINENRTTHVIVGGDFNAKIGRKTEPTETYIGEFGLGTRNERGKMLANFLERENLYLMNSFFEKKEKRKWTWRSPDGKTKNEIDFIISRHKYIVQNVDVVNQFNTGSDHRMVRSKILINTKLERKRKMKQTKTEVNREKLREENEEYKRQLKENFLKNPGHINESVNEANERITKIIKETAENVAESPKKTKNKLSTETKRLLERRRQLIKDGRRDTIEYTETNKTVRKMAKQDILKHQTKQVQALLENNRGLNIFKRQNTHKKEITKIKDKAGNMVEDRQQILKIVESYYKDLYESKITNIELQEKKDKKDNRIINVNSEDIPEIDVEELEKALSQMKNGKGAGEDNILPEMLKESDTKTKEELIKLFNKCITEEHIPEEWENAVVVLLYKKGDPADLENYRPISLLSQLYKLFSRIITNRLERKLEIYQPREQAGFRRGYSTTEHLHTVRQVIEKSTEYNIEIWMAFVDFRKAFDTVEIWAVIKSLRNARVDQRYINLIENIYEKSRMTIKTYETTDRINLKRGVRQGDVISPKLFTLVLEDIFKNLKWEDRGLNIQGEHLHNLRFADDIVLFAKDKQELIDMLEELQEEATKIGLHMNNTKTQFTTNVPSTDETVLVHGQTINRTQSYIYLGQAITLGKQNQEMEVDRRIRLGWAAYGKFKNIFNMNIPMVLKAKFYNECMLPVTTYGSETWVLTKKIKNKLKVHQRAVERRILGISLKDHKTNQWIREKTKVTDIIERIGSLKWQWAGHVARHTENWSGHITRWRPWGERRSTGRPQQRWYDDIKKVAGLNWYQIAQSRDTWTNMREAYIQWIENG